MTAAPYQRVQRIAELRRYIRCAVAIRLHNTWLDEMIREASDREERIEVIMSMREYHNFGRELDAKERSQLDDALAAVPANLRSELSVQAYRLRSEVYRHLGAEDRRRVAEIRCWLIDAIESLEDFDYTEARRLVIDALHQLKALLSAQPQYEKPSRRKLQTDEVVRARMQLVITALERQANDLRAVS